MAPPKQSPIVRFYDLDVKAKDSLGRTQEQILAWSDSQLEHSHNYIQMLFPLPEGSPFNYAAPVIDLETMKAFRANSELRQRLRQSLERMLTFYGFTTSIYPEPGSEEGKVAEEQEQQTAEGTSNTSKTEEGIVEAATASSEAATTELTTETTPGSAPSVQSEAPASKPAPQTSPCDYYVVRGPNFRKASRNWAVRMDHNHLRITRILRCLRVLGLQKECDAFFAALQRVYNDPAISIGPRSLEFWTRAVKRPLYIAPDDDRCDWLKAWEKEQKEEKQDTAVAVEKD